MKEADVRELRVQSNQEDVAKVADMMLDFLELNQLPKMVAILAMWNIIILTFKLNHNFTYEEFETTILNLLKESKSAWTND